MNIKMKLKLIERMRATHAKAALKKLAERFTKRDAAIASLNKKYGSGTIVPVTGSRSESVTGIATGFSDLDDLLTGDADEKNRTVAGTGIGWPRGRIIEVYGPEASGKTTLTLHAIAAIQKLGGVCAFIDAEHALDTNYAAKLGVVLPELLINQPDNAEQALDIIIHLTKTGGIDLIVLDSVAAMTPQDEDEEDVGKNSMALQARLMSKALRKLTHHVAASNTCVIFINQTRMKVGRVFGNPETTSGGNALKFYASVRVDIRNVGQIKKSGKKVGQRSRIRTIKNKCAAPFREIFVDLMPNRGITETYREFDAKSQGDDD
jgi:recombination protein RecA